MVFSLARSQQQTYVLFPDVLVCSPFPAAYMNSMLATLNLRQHVRDKVLSNDLGWNTMQLDDRGTYSQNGHHRRPSISAVEFAQPPSLSMACVIFSFLNVHSKCTSVCHADRVFGPILCEPGGSRDFLRIRRVEKRLKKNSHCGLIDTHI